MLIGMSSACFYPYVDTEKSIETMKKIGFDAGEIFLNTFSEYGTEFGKILLEQRLKNNFNINSVHSFSSSFEPYLFDDYKRRREDSFHTFKEVCKTASIIGAKCYTFHGMRYADIKSVSMSSIVDIYDRLTYTAAEYGVKLCQENVFWCMSGNIQFLSRLKERCRGPLYFTLDIKQAFKSGKSPEQYIDVMGSSIENFHINDRDTENTCLLPGEGNIDYKKISCKFKEIEYNGIGIIEVYRENYHEYSELFRSKRYLEGQFVF